MKFIGLGIGILLFSILLCLCSAGLELVSLAVGTIGLITVVYGSLQKDKG